MKEVRLIDSLNQVAYAFVIKTWIHPAMRHQGPTVKSASINKEKRKASNNLGFCAFMRMDFEQAEKFHMDVYNLTKNELELLIADIGLMKIYQRTALNKGVLRLSQ